MYLVRGDLGTERALYLGQMTTVQRNAFTPSQSGAVVYDTTLLSLYQWNGTAWVPVGASSALAVQTISASGAITAWNSIVEATAAANITLTLPTLVTGELIYVKKVDSGVGSVTIALTQENIVLYNQNDAVVIGNDGTNTYMLATGEINAPFLSVTSLTTLSGAPQSVRADATGGSFTVTLPAASSSNSGNTVSVTKTDVSTNNVLVAGMITSTSLLNQGDGVLVRSDGSSWITLANFNTGGGAAVVFRPAVQALDSVDAVKPTVNPVIDGYTIALNDRVLFTNLGTGNNEVYKATVSLNPVTWVLQTDGQSGTGAPANGDTVYVTNGSTYANELWSYGGSTWNQISSLSNVWNWNGSTVGTVKSLGTLDANALPIITTGVTRFTLAAASATLASTGNSIFTTDTGSSATFKTLDTGALALDSGTTGAINIGTGANAKTITIGNYLAGTAATTLNLGSGAGGSSTSHIMGPSGAYILDGGGATTYAVGNSTTTGTISIGGSAQTGTITLGSSTGTNIVAIGAGTGQTDVQIANVTTLGSVEIGNGMTTGQITIGSTTNGTGNIVIGPGGGAQTLLLMNANGAKTINIGNGSSGNTINIGNGTGGNTLSIGTGAGANTLTLGSTNTTSAATVKAGTNPVSITTNQPLTGSVLRLTNAVDTIDQFITNATPEGAITGSIGDIATDATAGKIYIKQSGTGTNTGWKELETLSTTGAWDVNGNTGLVDGTSNLLGTLDAVPVRLISTGTTRFTLDAASAKLTSTGNATITTDTGSSLTLDSLDTGAVNLGNGANTKTVTIGNVTGASQIILNSGTSGITSTTTNGVFAVATGTGTVNVSADATANAINIGTGAGVKTVTIGSTNTTSPTLIQSGTGNTSIQTTGTGQINIGTNTATGTINLGTGANPKTVQIGNTTGASGVLQAVGTGNYSLDGVGASTYTVGASTVAGTITIGGTAQTGSITLGNSSAAQTLNLATGSGTGTVNIATGGVSATHIGDGAFANAITIGNTTGATSLTEKVGTGNYVLDGVAASTYTVGTSTVAGTISIGGTAQTGTLTLGRSTAAQTTNIANTTGGIQTIAIGNGTSGNAITIGNGANTVAQTISIGAGASAANNTINIGTGTATAGTKTISIGATDTFTTTKIIGPETRSVALVTSTGTVGAGNRYEMVNGTVTRTMPASTGTGRIITIKNTGTGTVTVAFNGTEHVDSGSSYDSATVSLSSDVSQDFIDIATYVAATPNTGWQRI